MAKVTVSKWGNCLGVRIPAGLVEQQGLRPGDELEVTIGQHGAITLSRRVFDNTSFFRDLAAFVETSKPSEPAVRQMRDEERY
jgi:antitoxin MazE